MEYCSFQTHMVSWKALSEYVGKTKIIPGIKVIVTNKENFYKLYPIRYLIKLCVIMISRIVLATKFEIKVTKGENICHT